MEHRRCERRSRQMQDEEMESLLDLVAIPKAKIDLELVHKMEDRQGDRRHIRENQGGNRDELDAVVEVVLHAVVENRDVALVVVQPNPYPTMT